MPPYDTTAGDLACEYAESVGLDLDPWQRHVLTHGLGEVAGHWAAFEVAITVARQSGKGAILEARELAGIMLFDEQMILHTAHELKTSEEARLRMEHLCESSPDLDRQVRRVVRANGKESIEFRNGARIKYIARSRGSGRGFTGDLLVMDEFMILNSEPVAALLPTLAARPNPQVWYTGSAHLEDSEQQMSLRARMLAGDDPSLAAFEWSAPDGADLDDREMWAVANPAMGIRIDPGFIENERAALPDREFARERLSIPDTAARASVIDADTWQELTDRRSTTTGQVAFAVDVPPEQNSAAVSVAGWNAAGKMHVELVPSDGDGNYLSGVGWAPGRLADLVRKHRPCAVALDPAGPAGGLLEDIRATLNALPAALTKDLELVLVSGREMAQACAALVADIGEGKVAHVGQPPLNVAVDAGRKRRVQDAWAWHRRDTASDISPLVSVTAAAHALRKHGRKPRRSSKVKRIR